LAAVFCCHFVKFESISKKVEAGFCPEMRPKKEVAMSTSHCSTSDCSDEVAAPHAFARFATRTAQKAAALFTAWQNRRALYRMGAMSDHELSDIGLTRADLYAVESGPVFADPTARLGALAHENTDIENRENAARCIA
jgi:uncharacterized protein YjiS (DUF1127 family)